MFFKKTKKTPFQKVKTIAVSTFNAFNEKNIPLLAAGIAYFATLSFFPLMIAGVGLAGVAISPDQVASIGDKATQFLPHDIANLITSQLDNVTKNQGGSAIALIIGIGLAIFSVSGSVQNMMTALNISYSLKENRNFFKLKLISFALTFMAIMAGLVLLPVIFVGSPVLRTFGVPEAFIGVYSLAKWLIFPLAIYLGLAILYKFGPNNRAGMKWNWLNLGAAIATTAWLVVSIIFSIYLQSFANFSQSYSIFAGIIGLMMWLNLSATIIILGAEIDNQIAASNR